MKENFYETVFILTPVLSDSQTKDLTEEYKKYLEENFSKIKHQEHWGLKKLSYPIQKKQSGWYCLVEFISKSDLISKLELKLKNDERVMRYLTIKLDKHAIAYSNIRKKKLIQLKNN